MASSSNNALDGGPEITVGDGGPEITAGDGGPEITAGDGGDHRRCLTESMVPGSVESQRYYLSRRTVFEMLKDRGYAVSDADLTRTLADFRTEFGDMPEAVRLRFTVSLLSDPRKKVLVMFMGGVMLKTEAVRNVYKQILGEGLSLQGLILVLEGKPTSQCKKALQAFPFKVELFQITDLIVNISKHVLQPTYELLTPREKKLLLKKYKTKEEQLPRILQDDAIAKYYGLEKGRAVKMTYNGGLVDSMTAYRCVK